MGKHSRGEKETGTEIERGYTDREREREGRERETARG